jgi:hypothetical protein
LVITDPSVHLAAAASSYLVSQMETVSANAFFALVKTDFLDGLAVLGSGGAVGSLE